MDRRAVRRNATFKAVRCVCQLAGTPPRTLSGAVFALAASQFWSALCIFFGFCAGHCFLWVFSLFC